MHGNGSDAYAGVAARVAELEAALGHVTRKWEAELVPRLVQLERDVDRLAAELAALLRNRTEAAGAHLMLAPAVSESSSAGGADDGAASVPPVASVARSSPSAARERPAPPRGEESTHVRD